MIEINLILILVYAILTIINYVLNRQFKKDKKEIDKLNHECIEEYKRLRHTIKEAEEKMIWYKVKQEL